MLITDREDAYRRRKRRSALLQIGGLALSIVGAAAAAAAEGSPAAGMLGALWSTAASFIVLILLPEARRPDIPSVETVFDRRIDAAAFPAGDGKALHLYWEDLQRLSEAEGLCGLSEFVGAVGRGAACHDPAEGLIIIDALLLKRDGFPPDGRVAAALEAVRARLLAAQAAGARFCLMPITGWSGLAETNLGLVIQ